MHSDPATSQWGQEMECGGFNDNDQANTVECLVFHKMPSLTAKTLTKTLPVSRSQSHYCSSVY